MTDSNLSPAKTILVVDDDEMLTNLVVKILQRAGYVTPTACNGAEAFLRIKDCVPDVILADVMMPTMDGFSFLQQLRARPELRDIPLIFLTAKDTTGDKVKGFQLGADDYITKPFEPAELIARIESKIKRPPVPSDEIVKDHQTGMRTATQIRYELQRELDRSRKARRTGIFGLLELTELSRIRQLHGPLAEGEIIQQVSKTLAAQSRPLDLFGYDGHGRFFLLLPETTPSEANLYLGAIGCAIAEQSFSIAGKKIRLTSIIGFTQFPPAKSSGSIFEEASIALEQADSQKDLQPRQYKPEMQKELPRDSFLRNRTRSKILLPIQLLLVILLSYVLPFFLYRLLDSIGFDISWWIYLFVVAALALTAFFIWLEGFLAIRRMEPPRDPKTPYPAATAIIAAYLPNEAATILESVRTFLDVDYPSPIQILLAYNTPRDLPVEGELAEIARAHPNFQLLRVAESTSKAQNVNAALSYVQGEFVGIFDADHLPGKDIFLRAWRWLSHGADVVQGHCVIRNGDTSWVARMIAVEFEAIYAVSHPGRARLHAFAVFGGSNGFWKTDILRETRLLSFMLTEDIDSSIRLAEAGRSIVFDPLLLSRELAPIRLGHLWNQRMRWAQGWYQVSVRHFWQSIFSKRITARQKFGIFWLLGWREVYPWIADQMFPLIAFWALKFGGLEKLDWLIPIFVMTTLFTLSVGPGQTLFAYLLGTPEIKKKKAWYLSYLLLSSLFYTEMKNILARVAQFNEIMRQREWRTTPRGR